MGIYLQIIGLTREQMTNARPSDRLYVREKLTNGRVRLAAPSKACRNRIAVVPDVAIVIEDYDQIQAKAAASPIVAVDGTSINKNPDKVARKKTYWKNHDNYDYGDDYGDGLDIYDFDDDDYGYYYDDESSVDSDSSWSSRYDKILFVLC